MFKVNNKDTRTTPAGKVMIETKQILVNIIDPRGAVKKIIKLKRFNNERRQLKKKLIEIIIQF